MNTNKKRNSEIIPFEKFILQILIYLPFKNFKMVPHYGFYSRSIFDKLKKTIDIFKKMLPCQGIHFNKSRCTGLSE